MVIVRTVTEADLDGVLALAKLAYPGMTTLPPDRDALKNKLAHAQASVNKAVEQAHDELYFLVMEDLKTGQLIGTAAIIACLGAEGEFYSYKLNKVTQSFKELDKKITFDTLNLSNHFEGFAEVASLYLHPDFRCGGNGKFLARSRYLFMAQFRTRFPARVMADIRGQYDEHGNSPFWNAVGRHFFDMEFTEADLYGATHGNQFIADLMPKYPLYVNMLPPSAQAVIGVPNEMSKPAHSMLLAEGFRWHGHVDIFDASPSIDVDIDDVKSISESRLASVVHRLGKDSNSASTVLIANDKISEFRSALVSAELWQQADQRVSIALSGQVMAAMSLTPGDSIRYLEC